MGKIEKKKKKLQERIDFLEEQMYINLKQKTSSTAEIDLAKYTNDIAKLRQELQRL
jgi:hypothetical protein